MARPIAERRTPRTRHLKTRVFSVGLLALVLVLAGIARSHWFAYAVATRVQHEIASRTGLRVTMGTPSFSIWSLAARVENIDISRDGHARLAHINALEVAPSFASLWKGQVNLSRLIIDGGDVTLQLHTRNGAVEISNGPESHGGSGGGPPGDLPFRDIAISDLRVHVQHDTLGSLDLQSVDLDVVNASPRRLMVGLLADQGEVHGQQVDGPIQRLEARVVLDLPGGVLRVATAHAHVGSMVAEVRDAAVSLHGEWVSAVVQVETPVTDVLRFIPGAPVVHGTVQVALQAKADISHRAFNAEAVVDGQHLDLVVQGSDGLPVRYGLGDQVHLRARATPERVDVGDFRALYGGATVTSSAVALTLGPSPVINGRLTVAGLDFTRLMYETSVTPRTKILWTIGGDIDVHGTLAPFRLVAGLPNIETRDFAVLRDYFTVMPQRPVVHLARARVTGQMVIDPQAIAFVGMTATFGRSRVTVERVRVRLSHDTTGRDKDLRIDRLHADPFRLDDVGSIADLAVTGDAAVDADLYGDFSDPPMEGTARFHDFTLSGLPFGDMETPPGTHWRLRNVRVDVPLLTGHHRQSQYEVRDGYLDFRRYQLTAGARVHTGHFLLADFYNMFRFEGDPTFAPFDGVGQGDVAVDYVLGRPGDDPDGVMSVDAALHDWTVTAYNEQITDVSARAGFTWLHRRLGARGARTRVESLQGTKGTGSLAISGTMDPGGALHFVAAARNVPLASLDAVQRTELPADGVLGALVTVEGTPDAPRLAADGTLSGVRVLGRSLGAVDLHVRQTPEGPPARTAADAPPGNRVDVEARALNDQLNVTATFRPPWEPSHWHDPAGLEHHDWERAWSRSVMSARVALSDPVDVLPWLPPAVLARLGTDAVARTRARVDIDHAVLDDVLHGDASAVVDVLQVRDHGVAFSLAPGAALTLCLRHGTFWIAPFGTNAGCAEAPGFVRALTGTVTGPEASVDPLQTLDLLHPQVLGPEGTRLWLAGGGVVDGRFVGSTRGEFDLGRAASLVPGVTWGQGTGEFEVTAQRHGDNRAEPVELSGALTVRGASLGITALPSPVEDIDLEVQLRDSRAVLTRAHAQYGAGTVDLTGGVVRLNGTHLERVDVPLHVRGLAYNPEEGVDIAADADATLRWSDGNDLPVLSGDVALTRVRYTRPFSLSADLSGRLRGPAPPSADRQEDPSSERVRFDLEVTNHTPMRVVNNLIDADLRFSPERPFRVMGTNQHLGVVGTVEVSRGTLRLYGAEFDVRRGRVELDNPERVQPDFDLLAQTEVRRAGDTNRGIWRVNLHAYGGQERLSLDLSSEPALTQEDVILLLLFRLTRAEMDRLAGSNVFQAAVLEAAAAASGLDRAVLGVVPLIDEFRLGSAYNPRSNRTDPQLSVGGQLTDRVRLGASTTLSDQNMTRITGDVRLGENVSLQGTVESPSTQASSQLGNVNLGLDLRWRLEFE